MPCVLKFVLIFRKEANGHSPVRNFAVKYLDLSLQRRIKASQQAETSGSVGNQLRYRQKSGGDGEQLPELGIEHRLHKRGKRAVGTVR